MTLKIVTEGTNPTTIKLDGRLDTHTAPDLDKALDGALAKPGTSRLVFDLSRLGYLSSAGIRCFVRARKALEPKGGKVAIINPQPGVRKVLEIVKAIPGGIFTSIEELDAYLDVMQRQVNDPD
jgi:anti-anti-sigma factor